MYKHCTLIFASILSNCNQVIFRVFFMCRLFMSVTTRCQCCSTYALPYEQKHYECFYPFVLLYLDCFYVTYITKLFFINSTFHVLYILMKLETKYKKCHSFYVCSKTSKINSLIEKKCVFSQNLHILVSDQKKKNLIYEFLF